MSVEIKLASGRVFAPARRPHPGDYLRGGKAGIGISDSR